MTNTSEEGPLGENSLEKVDDAKNSLADWIAQRRTESLGKVPSVPSDSWFLTNEVGKQIARNPPSSSLGKSYAHRDYFHGQGPGQSKALDSENLSPIKQPHQSDVYRSSSSGLLKVAFSVPVWSGSVLVTERKVIGVLAMSLDLGEFDALEAQKSEKRRFEVLLIDIGEYSIDGDSGKGLVLHHHRGPPFGKDDPLPVLRPSTLDQIRRALEQSSEEGRATLIDYQDSRITGGKSYLGAIRSVDSCLPPDHAEPTNWLVLVQEPAER